MGSSFFSKFGHSELGTLISWRIPHSSAYIVLEDMHLCPGFMFRSHRCTAVCSVFLLSKMAIAHLLERVEFFGKVTVDCTWRSLRSSRWAAAISLKLTSGWMSCSEFASSRERASASSRERASASTFWVALTYLMSEVNWEMKSRWRICRREYQSERDERENVSGLSSMRTWKRCPSTKWQKCLNDRYTIRSSWLKAL